MPAPLLPFPFVVMVLREHPAWLVVARDHGWLFGSCSEALTEASELARGVGLVAFLEEHP